MKQTCLKSDLLRSIFRDEIQSMSKKRQSERLVTTGDDATVTENVRYS